MSDNHAHTLLHTYIAASQLSEKLRDDEEAQMTLARVLSALRALDDGPSLETVAATVRDHTICIGRLQTFELNAEYSIKKLLRLAAIAQEDLKKLQSKLYPISAKVNALKKAQAKASDKAINQSVTNVVSTFPPPEVFSRKVEDFELSVRSKNCLRQSNIIYVGDLVQLTQQVLLRTPNFGMKSLKEVTEGILEPFGLYFGTSTNGWKRPD